MTIKPIILDGGLSLVLSPQQAPPGSLRDCKNFEVAHNRGYRKIQGIRGYSGGTQNGVVDPYVLHSYGEVIPGTFWDKGGNIAPGTLTNASTFTEGVEVTWGNGGNYDINTSTLSEVDGSAVVCFFRNTDTDLLLIALANITGRLPAPGDTIVNGSGGTASLVSTPWLASRIISEGAIDVFGSYANTVDGVTRLIHDFDLSANSDTHAWPVPVNPLGGVRGGFWFKDRKHFVGDIEARSFRNGGNGGVEPARGDTILVFYSGTYPTGEAITYTVEKCVTASGDWNAGTAAGTIYLIMDIGADSYSSVIAPTDVQVITPYMSSDPFTLGGVVRSQFAALFKQGEQTAVGGDEYQLQDLGYELRFSGGDNVPTVLNRANRDTALEATVTTSAWMTCGTATGWTNSSNAQGATNATVATQVNNSAVLPPLLCTNFGFDIPDTAVVLGVKMRFTRRKAAAGFISAKDREIRLIGIPGLSQDKKQAALWPGALTVSSEYGSASDLWNTSISASMVNDTGFGVSIAAEAVNGSEATNREIDSVEIQVTYKDRSSLIYFGDTATTSLTSITSAGTTATATSAAAHGFTTGQTVTIAGATPLIQYNGDYVITVTGLTTFTYTFAGSAGVAAAGTLTAYRNFGSARLIWYHKEKGDWTTNDAQGTMTLYEVTAPTTILVGQSIRTAAAGAGTLIATVASACEKVYLPPSNALETNASQWEFTREMNFFGSIGTEQIGGASGADFAFTWDGTYCIRMRTGIDANQDKPRHIAKVGDQLALGYIQGVTMYSDLGYPESFAGIVGGTLGGSSPISDDTTTYVFAGGAQEVKHGDSVYGILPLADQNTAVFCRNSIQMVVGSGGSLVARLVPGSSGIIEYTHGDIGVPFFLDYRGIGTLSATAAFGDFARGRLSDAVAPWLIPRLQQIGASFVSTTGPRRVEVIRNKNQARIFFDDKWCLTMTLVGNDFSNPQFTTQLLPFVPAMTCVGVTSGGKDLLFLAPFGMAEYGAFSNDLKAEYEADANIVQNANLYAPAFVYQGDVGTTWDDQLPIDAYIEVNGGAAGKEWEIEKFQSMIVSGQCFGFAPFGVNYGVDFGDIETGTPQNVNGGSTTASGIKAFSERPFSQMENIKRDGYALSMKFSSSGASVYGATTTQTSPYKFRPFTLQAIILTDEALKLRRGGS